MIFNIKFHGPFRVATGAAKDGRDATYDPVVPLPSSSLKGLMRTHAARQLRLRASLVEEVFGGSKSRSPWSWSDVRLVDAVPRIRTQVRIDPETFTSIRGALHTNDEVWPESGRFEIVKRDFVEAEAARLHMVVLMASAQAITALGSDRRRGLGWVSITPEQPWDEQFVELLINNRAAEPEGAADA